MNNNLYSKVLKKPHPKSCYFLFSLQRRAKNKHTPGPKRALIISDAFDLDLQITKRKVYAEFGEKRKKICDRYRICIPLLKGLRASSKRALEVRIGWHFRQTDYRSNSSNPEENRWKSNNTYPYMCEAANRWAN